MSIVFCHGAFVAEDQASISIFDRGFLFGDGVFTTIRLSNGILEAYELHIKRLYEQCRALAIEPEKIDVEIIRKLIQCNGAQQGVWRVKVILTGGCAPALALPLRKSSQPIIFLKPDEQTASHPLSLAIFPQPLVNPHAGLKSLSYLSRLMVKNYAVQEGCEDVLITGENGAILETAFSNLFWRQGNYILTPATSLPLMRGISLLLCLEALSELGFEIREGSYALENLPVEANVFTCNAMKGPLMVERIGSKQFATDPVFWSHLCKSYRTKLLPYSLYSDFHLPS